MSGLIDEIRLGSVLIVPDMLLFTTSKKSPGSAVTVMKSHFFLLLLFRTQPTNI